MKFIYLLLALVLLYHANPQAVCAGQDNDLQLTITVTSQRYCLNKIYDGEYDLILKLQLRYTNTGKQTLILEKGGNLITYFKTGSDLKSLAAARYGHILWMSSNNEGVTETGSTPSSSFVALKPDEFYEIEGEMRFPSAKELLAKGRQYLQVVIPTWSGTDNQAHELRKRWKKTGALWYKPARSQPMEFTVEKEPKVVECPPDA